MIVTPSSSLDAREVKSRADFLAIASRYMRLRRAGRQFVGLCPFHSERHPSCYVHPEKKIFFCFGCGRGGDVFDFVMLAESCAFSEAVKIISGFPGVASESGPRSGTRFRASVGASPSAAKRQSPYSPESRTLILKKLDATNRQLRAIDAVNQAASIELATACEPERSLLLEETK